MIGNKCKNNEKGLTLLGLILTIIVLLILAGVSIAMLTGENGIIDKAKEHEIQAQLAIIEEAANIIYVEKKTLGIKNVDIGVVARQLQEDGYQIKVVFGEGIDHIELVGPDIITIDKVYSIAVDPKRTDGEIEVYYFAIVKGKYFEIKNKENGIEVKRIESDLSEWEEPNILSASTPNAGYITINSIDQDEKKIFISGINYPGSEELNVTWGKKTAKKQIKVLSKLNYLNEVVLKDYKEIPEDIKEKLAQEDYVVEDKTLTTIEEILLTSPEYMPIEYTSQITAEIKSSSKINFYAVIDEDGDGVDEYYKIIVKDGQVQADMTPTNVNNETPELVADNQNGLIAVGSIDDTTNPIIIPITSLNSTGLETITVHYGSISKNCNIEILSKLGYLDKLLENEEEFTDETVENLKDDGYEFTKIPLISSVSLQNPTEINTNETADINLTYESSSYIYYVMIEGYYYEIVVIGTDISVSKDKKTQEDIQKGQLEVSFSNNYLSKQQIVEINNGFNITIKAGNTIGTTTINLSYGGHIKSCTIKIKQTIAGLKESDDELPENITIIDKNNDEITVPKGFKIADDSADTVKEGVVVIAPDGSEFVWVPVENINRMIMCKGSTGANNCRITKSGENLICTTHGKDICGKLYINESAETFDPNMTSQIYSYNSGYREPAVLESTSAGDYVTGDEDRGIELLKAKVGLTGTDDEIKNQWKTQIEQDFKKMAMGVYNNKGFYIGRYATSLDGDSKTHSIRGGEIFYESRGTWYAQYKRQKDYSKNNNLTDIVGSDMIWGCQYDQMMLWMLENSININSTIPIEGAQKSTNNNFTGKSEADKLNNVYDLLGGATEWTQTANGKAQRVYRGGRYSSDRAPSFYSGSNPHKGNTILLDPSKGTRITLYIK